MSYLFAPLIKFEVLTSFVFYLEEDRQTFVLSDGQIVSGSKVYGGSTEME